MYYQRVLHNGITVVAQKMPGLHSVTTGIWVNAGSYNERENEAGITHFIEHMLFKGTPKRNAQQIAQQMDSVGGLLNAFTSKEVTCYHARLMDHHLPLAIELLSDLVVNSLFLEEEMRKEKGVVLEEINMSEDLPDDVAYDLLAKAYFGNFPLAKPILGNKESVSAFTKADIEQYMARRYTPENIVVAAAGSFDFELLCDLVASNMETLTSPQILENTAQSTIDFQLTPSFLYQEKPVEQAHLYLALPGYAMQNKNTYALSILNNAFGGSMSSRLFQSIREERGLAYEVFSAPASYSTVGMQMIYAAVNAEKAEEALSVLIEEISKIQQDGITEEEFVRSKEQLKGNYSLGVESTRARMNAIGRRMVLLNELITAEDVLQSIEDVTLEDVTQASKELFNIQNLSASAVGNIQPQKLKSILDNAHK